MNAAKTQIMQVLAQWIANPTSVGNVIALKGPMGVGKTSFARNGIANVLKRPFAFFSLGGASDISHFIGHSYTYEGSTWGRVIDSLMQARCMNPVFYFDELDKISETPHGEEITSLLIHLTDRSQNMQFHDRYFAGVDFDLSQCLFVFSFNDESKVHPILKDRMNVIQCSGYSEEEKKIILTQYIWPDMLKRFKLESTDIVLTDEAIRYMIREFSTGEEGVRSVIRVVETLVMRVNLLRIAAKDDPATKAYKFYMDITFPLTVTTAIAEKLLTDVTPSTLRNGVPFGMYA
jgi:ATP-dependent Lon protease